MKRIVARRSVLALMAVCLALPGIAGAAVVEAVGGLNAPVRITGPEGDDRLFVVERAGLFRIFDQQGASLGTFLDLTGQTTLEGERGMTGLAFPPDYATSGRFYITHTDLAGDMLLVRYEVDGSDPNLADASSREVLLTIAQPGQDHNGGHIAFGPDGMLYLGLGDGEYGGDPGNRAQDPQELLGKILRLDVSGATGYAVPADNPYVGDTPRDEIWSMGLRNPWVFSFDRLTGDLYVSDVGESVYEEINIVPASSTGRENFGWRLMEGTNCFNPGFGCQPDTLTLPAYAYTHAGGSLWRCAVGGGYVYRGSKIPSLQGEYFFSDYCSRQIWSLNWTEAGGVGTVTERTSVMTPSGGYNTISSLGQDGLGELYVIDHGAGRIFRLVNSASSVPAAPSATVLEQNQPNPFNPSTEIAFTVGASQEPTQLDVYDAAGRKVRTLVSSVLAAGDHAVTWDGTDERGRSVPSGIYLYQLRSGGSLTTKKMLLLE